MTVFAVIVFFFTMPEYGVVCFFTSFLFFSFLLPYFLLILSYSDIVLRKLCVVRCTLGIFLFVQRRLSRCDRGVLSGVS